VLPVVLAPADRQLSLDHRGFYSVQVMQDEDPVRARRRPTVRRAQCVNHVEERALQQPARAFGAGPPRKSQQLDERMGLQIGQVVEAGQRVPDVPQKLRPPARFPLDGRREAEVWGERIR
jgi:hypothetical protein